MKKYLALTLLLLSFSSYSQESNSFYARIGLSEPSIGYKRKINSSLGLGFEVGYRFRFVNEAYAPYGVITYPIQSFVMQKAYQGISVRPVILHLHRDDRTTFSFSTHYQYLSANNIIYDPGKNGGSNTSDYAEYSDTRHQIGLSMIYDKSFRKLPALSWFAEIGVRHNFFERHYTIEGTYSQQYPSNRVSSGNNFGVIFNAGFKINFLSF